MAKRWKSRRGRDRAHGVNCQHRLFHRLYCSGELLFAFSRSCPTFGGQGVCSGARAIDELVWDIGSQLILAALACWSDAVV